MLRDYFEKIFRRYQIAKNEKFIDHPLVKLIKEDIPNYLEEITPDFDDYIFKGNAGKGNYTQCPSIAILDKKITDGVGKGYFVIYIFSKDTQRLYLSLNQAILGGPEADVKKRLSEKADEYRDKLGEIPDNFNLKEIDLGNPNFYSRYEVANIYAKEYTLENLSSEEELEADLVEILNLYNKLSNKIPNIWQISPGKVSTDEQDKLWPLFKENGFIGIGWLHDSRSYLEFKNKDDLKEALKEFYTDYQSKDPTQAANMVWDFTHHIKKGDIIIANAGYNRIRGIGIVKSDYIDPQNDENPGIFDYFWHLRKIDWKITEELDLNQKIFVQKTIKKIKENEWVEIKEAYIEKNPEYYDIFREIEGILDSDDLKVDIKQHLVEIFNELPFIWSKNDKVKGHPIGKTFYDLSNDLQKIAENINPKRSYHVEPYYRHTDQWYKRPYVYIEDRAHKNIFCPWDQHFVGFWFPEDLNSVYLTIHQSFDYARGLLKHKYGEYSEKEFNNYIKKHRKDAREFLIASGKVSKELIQDSSKERSRDEQVIFGRYYDKNNLPTNGEIVSDLEELLNLYLKLKPDEIGGNNTTFFEFLKEEGYMFDSRLIENFLLSLKVKPFVILTGNSGTGKTKVAQLFAKHINPDREKPTSKPIINNYSIKRSLTQYSKKHKGGWRLRKDELEGILKNSKNELDNLSLEINYNNHSISGKGYLEERLVSYSEDPQFYLYYKEDGPINEELSNITDADEIIINFISKNIIETKKTAGSNKRYEIVPVGANWTENRHILGFYNVIIGDYFYTNALDLIIKAEKDENNPYFLILDEMNLSHVERYFSDFLSAIESGEEIELYRAEDAKTGKSFDHSLPKEKISLSNNLNVIGTVNIDETTYMFSPKVLDRANTLEFLTCPAENYMNGDYDYSVQGNLEYLMDPLSDLKIRGENIIDLKNRFDGVKTNNNIDIWEILSSNLNHFQGLLKKADFDFGFRTINEIVRFMYVSWRYENKPTKWNNWERYFDAQIMQKMLPKLHGSPKELANTLDELEKECTIKGFSTSAKKLNKMIKTLKNKRYVAFTE